MKDIHAEATTIAAVVTVTVKAAAEITVVTNIETEERLPAPFLLQFEKSTVLWYNIKKI